MSRIARGFRNWCRETKGVAMVEFAILCIVFLLIISGIIDLGMAFYVKQVVTNASREGARYGVMYQTDNSGNRTAPSAFSPSIQSYVLNNYLSHAILPGNTNPQVTVSGTGYTTGTTGTDVQVTVTGTYNWIVLDNFIPTLNSSTTLAATTVMQCE